MILLENKRKFGRGGFSTFQYRILVHWCEEIRQKLALNNSYVYYKDALSSYKHGGGY